MLKTSLKFISQSRDGRSITLQDNTGNKSTNPNGYGDDGLTPSDILSYYISVARIYNNELFVKKITGDQLGFPTLEQMANGYVFTINTGFMTEQTESGIIEPSYIFKDGVLDINLYVAFSGYEDVVGKKGENFITGADFADAYKADSIVINDVIYDIDKSRDNNGYNVLYLLSELDEDITEFDILYRSNTKALLTSVSENIHAYACDKLSDQEGSTDWHNIFAAQSFREAAIEFFYQDVPDYYKANKLINSSSRLLKKFTI